MTAPEAAPPPPFHPQVLLAAAPLLGPLATGFVLAVNDHRLGLRDRVPLTFYAFFFLSFLGYMIVAWLHAERYADMSGRSGWLLARVLTGTLAAAAAVPWYRSQRRTFAAAGSRGAPAALYTTVGMVFSIAFDALVWQMFVHPR